MVKFVHMADTHLGYRARKGVINKWAIPNYSKPYEQEIYDCFLRVMEDISKIENLDFVVHCGDMFHIPSLYASYPPPEPARRVLKKALDIFFKNTKNNVPLIYIEGNHGVFRGYEYTPFESHISKEDYPNLYYFKEVDLVNAIKRGQSLSIEFASKKVRFYLFPYFEFKSFEIYKNAYDNWIEVQNPPKNDDFINIAVAHGSESDETLHKRLKSDDFNYTYIALGHEHHLNALSKNKHYAGSLLPLNFKERYEIQGYLIVDIKEKTKSVLVDKVSTEKLLKRTFEVVVIKISPKDSSEDIANKINKELNKYISNEGFNPKTSARLKFNFLGEMTYERNWQINDIMTKVRRDCFSQPERYNILQLIWKVTDISESIEDDISPGRIEDFILEKPDEEFKNFVEEKLSDDKSQYDVEKLTKFGMNAIKSALKIMEREKEV